MAGVKDKVITVESLSALHEYNKETFKTKKEMDEFRQELYRELDTKFTRPENDIIPIENGGTDSSDGAEGLANLFAAGETILSSFQYGDELPPAGNVGRIFFKRVIE